MKQYTMIFADTDGSQMEMIDRAANMAELLAGLSSAGWDITLIKSIKEND